MEAIAPGKVVLFGEYAVLRGHRAVVAAVARYARARLSPGPYRLFARNLGLAAERGEAPPRELAAAASLAGRLGVSSAVELDTGDFSSGGVKLGLGSSAAALAALAFAAAPGRSAEERFRLADEAHRESQGGVGSGVDVAASTFGGVLAFRRGGAIEALPVGRCGVSLLFVASGVAAKTPDLVSRVFAAPPGVIASAISELAETAEAAISAISQGEAPALVGAVRRGGAAIGALGAASGAPLYLPVHEQVAAIAVAFGGAAKPTGAGGGDLILVAAPAAAAAGLSAELTRAGFSLAPLSLDRGGARRADSLITPEPPVV